MPSFLGKAGDRAYLPIEALRTQPEAVFRGTAVARTFLSSGTTRAERSRAHFSAEGLARYREGSLKAFFDVIARVFATNAPQKVRGISLIPPVAAWPDSSLAQMVAWIGEEAAVTYVADGSDIGDAAPGAPVWVFGTAFHFLNLIDAGGARKLPRGSVVIETGGTKGKSREVTRAALFSELSTKFGVPATAIVSEYGMCELASQAYDCVDGGANGGELPTLRSFRFPPWVKLFVVQGPDFKAASGEGALAVFDPLRCDLDAALRTEDLVELRSDGSFVLRGRIPSAPLKGCSLLAEQILGTGTPTRGSATAQAASAKPIAQWAIWAEAAAQTRAETAASIWREFIADPALLAVLTAEIGSAAMAQRAIRDLERSAPTNVGAWKNAARASFGTSDRTALRWLYVLPENHSLVALHPLVLGWIAGLVVTLRLPARFSAEIPSAVTLLAKKLGVKTCDTSRRLGTPEGERDLDAALIYASDETIATLQQATRLPLQSFGSRVGVAVVDSPSDDALILAAIDALAVAQSGCMSVRALFLPAPATAAESRKIAEKLAEKARLTWSARIPALARIGLDLEAWRYHEAGFACVLPSDDLTPLVVFTSRDVRTTNWTRDLPLMIAARPFTLPIVFMQGSDQESFVKTTTAQLISTPHCGTVTAPLTRIEAFSGPLRPLGDANAPAWNGQHETRALFALTR